MQIFELAQELGVETKRVMEILGKTSHLNAVTEQEAEAVRNAIAKPQPEQKPVRFISTIRAHKVATPTGNVTFEDYKFANYRGTMAVEAILDAMTRDPRIMILREEPFESDDDRAIFRDMISQMVFTGPNDEPALDSGLAFLQAWFNRNEMDEVAVIMQKSLKTLIERAVRTKSYTRNPKEI